jgi:hypothetical protein
MAVLFGADGRDRSCDSSEIGWSADGRPVEPAESDKPGATVLPPRERARC